METKQKFRVPDEKARKFALGKFGESEKSKKFFKALVPFFEPIPEPRQGDWLDKHSELGQTFYEFKMSNRHEKSFDSDTIYIVPLEENMDSDMIEIIYYFTLAYYHSMKVKMLPPIDIRKAKITTRIYKGHYQYNAAEILKFLQKRLPSDGFCIIGIMMTDLYPKEGKNFVNGLASMQDRTGVFSFIRNDDNFFDERRKSTKNQDQIIFRSCKVLAHEIAHMFGMKHCIYYSCILNGSNTLDEADNMPLEPCPVCFRKLMTAVRFNPFERFEHLQNFCKATQGYFKPFFKYYGDVLDKISQMRDYTISILKEVYGYELTSSSSTPLKVIRDQHIVSLVNQQQVGLPIQFVTPRIIEIMKSKSPEPSKKNLFEDGQRKKGMF